MMCKKPYVKRPVGAKKKDVVLAGVQGALAVTPFGCGQCVPCRVNKSRVWTHRIMLEAAMNDENCFLTLTYDDDNLPDPPHVSVATLQKFLKRLRYGYEPNKFRYFAIGEYGSQSWRPHYHLALFGIGYERDELFDQSWPYGFHYCGDLNEKTAKYISGYVVKGFKGKMAVEYGKRPEFMLSSKKDGGIGLRAIKKIAEKINSNEYFEKRVIDTLHYGKKVQMPLGRYLREKLADEIGLTENEKKLPFWDYQDKFIHKHLEAHCYYDSICDEDAQKIKQLEKKQKIYKQRRKI